MKVVIPKRGDYIEQNGDASYTFTRNTLKLPDIYHPENGCFPPSLNGTEWDKDTTYIAGDIVRTKISQGGYTFWLFYKAIVDVEAGYFPPNNPLKWSFISDSGSNFSMFDDWLNTTFDNVCGYTLTYTQSDIDTIALLRLQSHNDIEITFKNDEASITKLFSVYDDRVVHNFNEYFFKGWNYKDSLIVDKYFTNITEVSMTVRNGSQIGTVIVGKSYDIGNALYGYKKQLRDFSKKVTNAEGYDYLQKGNHSNKLIVKLTLNNDRAIDIYDLLSGLSSTLCLYVLEDGEWVFGYFKDLYMVKSNPVISDYELEINGVI